MSATVPIVAVSWVMLIGLVALAGPIVMVLFIVRALLARRDSQQLNRDEKAQLVRLDESLASMEDRIANLETILMRADRPDGGAERETNR